MAAAASSVSSLTVVASSATTVAQRKAGNVSYIATGLNSFAGLKAQNEAVAALGVPECTERSFTSDFPWRRWGVVIQVQCDGGDIPDRLVLIGVTVLLRIEASVEKAE